MLVGVDWGGTKIEVVALDEDGTQLARVRATAPRSNYDACLALIVTLVAEVEQTIGRRGTIGVGLPGSLDREQASPRAPAQRG